MITVPPRMMGIGVEGHVYPIGPRLVDQLEGGVQGRPTSLADEDEMGNLEPRARVLGQIDALL